jgi:putative PIG3 family NAD(P)H quinone oxidoreductase
MAMLIDAIPETMSAVTMAGPGDPAVLKLESVPVPKPGPGQHLLRVEAAGVNRPDVLQRQGAYPPPAGHSAILGLEAAGTIIASGPPRDSRPLRWHVGDRVTALLNGGGYAQFCLIEDGSALPIPAGLTVVEAAALPETVFTVWHNVFQRGALRAGETLLVHGGTSGIGTIAIQLAKALGARVLATAGSSEKCTAMLRLGVDRAIDYRREDFVVAVAEATDQRGADVILDMVGGLYIARNIDAAASDGRIVQIAFLSGSRADIDFSKIMLKRLTYTGSTLRVRTNGFKAALSAEVERAVWPLFAAGTVRPVMDARFPLADAAKAHLRMEAGNHIGKIVLDLTATA